MQSSPPAGVAVPGGGSVPLPGRGAGALRTPLGPAGVIPSSAACRSRLPDPCFPRVLSPFLINLGVLIDETTADES